VLISYYDLIHRYQEAIWPKPWPKKTNEVRLLRPHFCWRSVIKCIFNTNSYPIYLKGLLKKLLCNYGQWYRLVCKIPRYYFSHGFFLHIHNFSTLLVVLNVRISCWLIKCNSNFFPLLRYVASLWYKQIIIMINVVSITTRLWHFNSDKWSSIKLRENCE